MDNSEPHVDDLLDQLRHISITSLVDGHSDEQTSQHEWSPSKQTPPFQASESPLSSRSPPAAAYLASSVSAHDILNFSLSSPSSFNNLNRSVGEPPGTIPSSNSSLTLGISIAFSNGTCALKTESFENSIVSNNNASFNSLSSDVGSAKASESGSPNAADENIKNVDLSVKSLSSEDGLPVDSKSENTSESNMSSTTQTSSSTNNVSAAANVKEDSVQGNSSSSNNHDASDLNNTAAEIEKSNDSSSKQLPVRRSLASALSFGRISLNPNAAEFVPTKPASSVDGTDGHADAEEAGSEITVRSNPTLGGLAAIPRTDSTNSNASDDEYRRYWREQLPDELLSLDDMTLELPLAEDITEFNDQPTAAGSRIGLGQALNLAGRVVASRPNRNPMSRVPMPGSPRSHLSGSNSLSSPPPMSSSWMVGPNAAGPVQNGPPPNSFSGPGNSVPGPHLPPGAVNANGFGYGPRPQLSPQPSPPRNSISPFSPPGPSHATPRFPPPHMRDGLNSPGFGRPFPHPEARPGLPPPFELPPGPAGLRERPLPPPWAGDGFDLMGGDMHMEGPFAEDAFHDPLAILVAEFPTFAPESLADMFFANNGDMVLTMEMLTQLEMQEESVRPPSGLPPPPLTPMDFPSLSGMDMMNGIPPPPHPYPANMADSSMGIRRMEEGDRNLLSRSAMPGGEGQLAPNFASVVRKQQPHWQYDRNGMAQDAGSGRGRGGLSNPSPLSIPSFPPDARTGVIGERVDMFSHPRDLHRHHQPWMEPGDTSASMLSEIREEAREHGRIQNMYFEQANQAYLNGNKVLAKELNFKGRWHMEQMKNAHAKAGEALFRQRNPSGNYPHGASPMGPGGQPRVLDLHSLHVSEAIQVLKRELTALKSSARNSRLRFQLFVFVGNGQNVKGRPSTRLSSAVERYIVEEERMNFVETQPGMLRVFL